MGTTPILAPRRNTRSSQVNRKFRTPSRRVSAVRMASSSQQRIARAVAACVVDDLELIDIEIAQGVGGLACLRALERALQSALELAPIHQPSEQVMAGVIGQTAIQFARLTNVMEHQHATRN